MLTWNVCVRSHRAGLSAQLAFGNCCVRSHAVHGLSPQAIVSGNTRTPAETRTVRVYGFLGLGGSGFFGLVFEPKALAFAFPAHGGLLAGACPVLGIAPHADPYIGKQSFFCCRKLCQNKPLFFLLKKNLKNHYEY